MSVQADDTASGQAVTVTHTPTPWRVYASKHFERPGIDSRPAREEDAISIVVAATSDEEELGIHGDTPEQAHANAAHIVRCVNAMPAMLELLEDVGNALTDSESSINEDGSLSAHEQFRTNRALISRIDAALKELRS